MLTLIGMASSCGTLVVVATFGGSLLAGKICATMLDEQRGYSTVVKLLVATGLAFLSFMLCFGGCMAGALITKH
jgi:hypothetical protein